MPNSNHSAFTLRTTAKQNTKQAKGQILNTNTNTSKIEKSRMILISHACLYYLPCNNCILLFFGIENIRTAQKLPSGKVYPRNVGMTYNRHMSIT